MPIARLNGIDLYYERSGAGPRLLFLNGSGATLESAAPFIAAFAKHFDVAAHDQRGLGRTAVPDGPYEMADYAADAAALAEHLEWDRYRVVGTSFGGMVAQELAVTFPERIERLALLCTSPGGAGGSSYPLHSLTGKDPVEAAAIAMRILDERFTPEWLADHPFERAIVEARRDRRNADGPTTGEVLQLDARRRHDVFDRLSRIGCPTFVASGRHDGIAPPGNGAAIAARIPGAVQKVYEGGHLFFLQDPTAVPEILAFLGHYGDAPCHA